MERLSSGLSCHVRLRAAYNYVVPVLQSAAVGVDIILPLRFLSHTI
jgi:hypothetical protein